MEGERLTTNSLDANVDETPAVLVIEDESLSDAELVRAARARANRRLATLWLVRIALLVGFIAIWGIISGRWVDDFWISSPRAVYDRLVEWISDGTLFRNLLVTLRVMAIGLVIGSLAGIAIGFFLGRIRFLAELLLPFIQAFYSIPKIALAPLIIMWFGIDDASHIVLTVIIVFFLVFENTFSGVRSVDRDLIEVSLVMGASRSRLWRKVIFPSAAEWVFTGLRLAIPYSLVGAVIAELLAGNEGIGYLVRNSSGSFDTTGTFAALIALSSVGMVLNGLVEWMSKHTGRWREARV